MHAIALMAKVPRPPKPDDKNVLIPGIVSKSTSKNRTAIHNTKGVAWQWFRHRNVR